MEKKKMILVVLGLCAVGGAVWWFFMRGDNSAAVDTRQLNAPVGGGLPVSNVGVGSSANSSIVAQREAYRGRWRELSRDQRLKLGFLVDERRNRLFGSRREYWFQNDAEWQRWRTRLNIRNFGAPLLSNTLGNLDNVYRSMFGRPHDAPLL